MTRRVVPQLLLLARHAESEKNSRSFYSSTGGLEPLTPHGYSQAETLGDWVRALAITRSCRLQMVFHSTTTRASETARVIASRNTAPLLPCAALDPLQSDGLSGLTASEAEKRFPRFAGQLKLYRAGLRSAYHVEWPGESIHELELRVSDFLMTHVLDSAIDGALMIVGHKSSLTCLMVQLLRAMKRYPEDFYGYMDIPVSSLTAVTLPFSSESPILTNIEYLEVDASSTSSQFSGETA